MDSKTTRLPVRVDRGQLAEAVGFSALRRDAHQMSEAISRHAPRTPAHARRRRVRRASTLGRETYAIHCPSAERAGAKTSPRLHLPGRLADGSRRHGTHDTNDLRRARAQARDEGHDAAIRAHRRAVSVAEVLDVTRRVQRHPVDVEPLIGCGIHLPRVEDDDAAIGREGRTGAHGWPARSSVRCGAAFRCLDRRRTHRWCRWCRPPRGRSRPIRTRRVGRRPTRVGTGSNPAPCRRRGSATRASPGWSPAPAGTRPACRSGPLASSDTCASKATMAPSVENDGGHGRTPESEGKLVGTTT